MKDLIKNHRLKITVGGFLVIIMTVSTATYKATGFLFNQIARIDSLEKVDKRYSESLHNIENEVREGSKKLSYISGIVEELRDRSRRKERKESEYAQSENKFGMQ